MNIWKPTGEKLESFPNMVARLIEENKKLLEKVRDYEERDRVVRRTGDGEKNDQGDSEGCPLCKFVDETWESDSLHSGGRTCPEKPDTEKTVE